MSLGAHLRREGRVAFSRKAQPVWFRLLKWAVFIVVGLVLWPTPYFWPVAIAGLVLGLLLHLVWRWGTRGWTRPWGGWDDLDAGRRE